MLSFLRFMIADFTRDALWKLSIRDSFDWKKICQLILESPYGIHDLSRIELDPSTQLPRFNMALELGLFLGANLLFEIKRSY